MNRSLKWLAPAAATLAFAGGAHAQSSVQVYGLMDANVGSFQNAGEQRRYRVDSGDMTTSFLGFKGTEDLGGGLKARFAIEHFLQLDTGAAGRFTGDAFWARNAYVGLSGGFGTVTLGRNTNPFFVSTLAFNAIGDSFGFSPSIRQVLTPNVSGTSRMAQFYGDTGWSNSLLYSSDTYNGFAVNLIGSLGEGAASATGKNMGGQITYFGGGLGVSLAMQKVKNGISNPLPAGFQDQTSYQVGASYDFGVVKLYGQYTHEKTKATIGTKSNIYGLGASVPLGGGAIVAQYGYAKSSFSTVPGDHTNKTFTAGYDYNISKRTDLYAMGMYDKLTGLSNGKTFAVGVRHRF